MERNDEVLRHFQAQAFPSWRRTGAFVGRAQSEAALAACGLRSKADIQIPDGKAVVEAGMLVSGGADVR
jgi:hypothetical protein